MKPRIGNRYTVSDADGRVWGAVTFRWQSDGTISGTLEPTEKYWDIDSLFRTKDRVMDGELNEPEGLNEAIVRLHPILIPEGGGDAVVAGIVFVSKELLLTCEG